ncbi:MAG: ComF family protein [Candidatus Omnitrophota bacterium]
MRGVADLAFPKICLSCKNKLGAQDNENYICKICRAKIKRNMPPFCHACGRHLEKQDLNKGICAGCLRKKLHFDHAYSPCLYEGVIKELIHEFKYKGKDHLGGALGAIMIEFIKEYGLPIDCFDLIIPMPLHKSRLREREFNQAEILSGHIASEFEVNLSSGSLTRHRYTKTQTELPIDDRFSNVKNSFSVSENCDLRNKNVLLIDDVLTTGATSSEAAATMKNAGANIIFVLTLAN